MNADDNREAQRYAVMGNWIAAYADRCTCGTCGTGYGHESDCGWEPLMKVSDLPRDAVPGALPPNSEPCVCNTGPGTDGPDEACPQHGRRYSDWVEYASTQQALAEAHEAVLARVEAALDPCETFVASSGLTCTDDESRS